MTRSIDFIAATMVTLFSTLPASAIAQVLSPQELFRRVSPGVVVVEVVEYPNGERNVIASGSGVVVGNPQEGEWLIATNCHVVNKAPKGIVSLVGRGAYWGIGKVVGRDEPRDICTINASILDLKFNPLRLPVAQVASSRSLQIGDPVYAIGAPQGLESTLSSGLISGFREYEGVRYIQTTTPISPGSSGGGLFDSQGRLVGITTMFIKEGQALNFAVPAELIASIPDLKNTNNSVAVNELTEPTHMFKPELSRPSLNDRWQIFYADDKQTLEIDTKTINRVHSKTNPRANQTIAWVRKKFSSPRNDGNGKAYVEDVRQYNFWCNGSGYMVNQIIQRDADGEVTFSHKYSISEIEIQSIVPDSIGEAIRDRACSP